MGDISTHAEITGFVVEEARRSVSAAEVPVADWTFLELGNFLTDVSQFRDPPAFHRARDVARARAQSTSRFAGLAGADSWVLDVFGQAAGPRHGALPEMMRLLLQALTHQIFDDDGLPVLGASLNLVAPGARPPLLPTHGIPPAEVTRVLAAHFTQYFPHEHVDFPPSATPLDRHRTDPMFVRESRGLIAYLERFIQVLSEALSQLEAEWVRAGGFRARAAQRQDLLVRLGNLLHPVEDYFFHSNTLELLQWQVVLNAHPRLDPAVAADHERLVADGLLGTALSPSSIPLRRKLHRRLRYPVWDAGDRLSTTTSLDATDLVYTGGFGQTDVWHTLGGALEGIESKIAQLPARYDLRRSPLVLVRLLLSRRAREAMVRAGNVEALWHQHLTQLRAGDYPTAIAGWQSSHLVCPHTADQLREAFALDLTTSERHSGRFATFPGPGAVLIMMLEEMQRERETSATAKAGQDGVARSIHAQVTDNGCSEEIIGTHSLMSKDSTDKEPMRAEAVALAKHASAGVAATLLSRVQSSAPITQGVDWDTVLRFFLRAPAPVGGTWEQELVAGVRAGATFHQPSVTVPQEQPRFALLGPALQPQKLAARRAGTARAQLEAYYRRFESNP